ncbi:MAG: hypothetical protein KGH55_00195 [Nanoarchaeota archaeon]|nr:hypothetical protein [Nanoarchaeota archaeon]
MRVAHLRYKILLVIFLAALASSLVLSLVPLPLICTQFAGCNAVQTSVYAKTFGISNSYYGIAIFALMSFLAILHIRRPHRHTKFLIHIGVFIGTLIVLYFLYLQQFVIHAYCKYCLVVDLGMIAGFIILNVPEKKIRKINEEASKSRG